MPYSKRFFKLLLFISLIAAVPAEAKDIQSCLERGKKEFSVRNYIGAEDTFSRCVRLAPSNEEARLSLAGVLLTQDDLDGANAQFSEALKNMKRSSPYISYTYSMLGDIALKKHNYNNAVRYYDRSLWFNAANVNSLVGKGVITEHFGNKLAAADLYTTALAVEPLNLIARKRLISLEPIYFSNEEMLDALKQRYAVLPTKGTLSATDRELFTKIHGAEQRGGIDYLKNKYRRLPPEYTIELYKGTGFAREVLSLAGFQALQKQIGQDALKVFLSAGVRVQDVFDLRDLRGKKIFLPDTTLTDRGFYVYTEALKGRKAFLLPNEPVPPTAAALAQTAKRVKDIEDMGYAEISRRELDTIVSQTQCSEDTLRRKMGLYVLQLGKTQKRYFVLARELPNDKRGIAFHYLMNIRSRRNPNAKVPRNNIVDSYLYAGYPICASDGSDWDD